MPVLFKEISEDLGLNLVQVGTVWGMISLSGLLTCLIGGVLGDRFGLKRIITLACYLTGLTGALRGLASDFTSLVAISFIYSILSSLVMINIPKVSRIWFSGRRFGFANGVQATGMSVGFTIGAMISATMLSPWLGGWRNVLFLYGLVTIILGIVWHITVREPGKEQPSDVTATLSMRRAISHVSRLHSVWLLGFALSGYFGCLQGVTGYLSLYLQDIGWSPGNADGVLAAFNIAGAFGALPVALLSDRLGRRKVILSSLMIMAIVGTTLLPVFKNELVWVMAVMIGFTRDSSMTLFIVMVMESEAVGVAYAGTAMGLLQTISRLGGGVSPPLGNSLASINISMPYFLWAAFAVIGLVILGFARETGQKAGT
jgi:NNP family nitrate/nitrite transporter-like MFS transporter